jgi:Zn-dependent M28 family amino/carboxypeptidase
MQTADLPATLRRHVERLAAKPRPPETKEHQAVRGYITRQLEDAGFCVRVDTHEEAGVPCLNVLTDPLPADESLPLLIIGAHYDSIVDSPGADDNASAVAALCEIARFIRPHLESTAPCQARLQLAAYDLEEYGLVGSGFHSRRLKQAGVTLRGMISLEMLGYADSRPGSQLMPPALKGMYPNVGNFIGIVANEESADLLRTVAAGMNSIDGLPVEVIAVPGDGRLLGETRLSDHSSFWDEGFPALMITDTSFFRNPHYHKASDTADTLDYDFLAKVTAGVCAATLRLINRER